MALVVVHPWDDLLESVVGSPPYAIAEAPSGDVILLDGTGTFDRVTKSADGGAPSSTGQAHTAGLALGPPQRQLGVSAWLVASSRCTIRRAPCQLLDRQLLSSATRDVRRRHSARDRSMRCSLDLVQPQCAGPSLQPGGAPALIAARN
jgi:hypothetical protein